MRVCFFRENESLALQPIFYTTGVSKLIYKDNNISAHEIIIHLAQRLKSQESIRIRGMSFIFSRIPVNKYQDFNILAKYMITDQISCADMLLSVIMNNLNSLYLIKIIIILDTCIKYLWLNKIFSPTLILIIPILYIFCHANSTHKCLFR